ncbi:hypothetical protein LL033_08230 [Clostridium estertheticum]|uniref:hypothetical protein n=1 Tax=Clostridium estertheticum TaxID=238834 RepID=UPI001C0E104E|nr:hypothetical protein [Clostridium estertheticum]MBU3214796.1 hypothetical protein [Clostridium estertheticum]WAG57207.1 hypothetical protein LL033_08230 [Clostridium estertheticum]
MVRHKCISCGKHNGLIPIFKKGTNNGDEEDYSRKIICKECLAVSEEYGTCQFCNEEVAYHINDLKAYQAGLYCNEHYLEAIPEDEDEKEDWDSFEEYILDPCHCN